MNKILLRTIGVISLFISFLFLFIFVIVHLVIPYHQLATNMVGYVILLFMAFLSLVSALGGFVFLRYKDLPANELKEKKATILIWSILFLATANICGILGFIVFVNLLGQSSGETKFGYIEELKKLEELKEEGLITAKEYSSKKKKILDI